MSTNCTGSLLVPALRLPKSWLGRSQKSAALATGTATTSITLPSSPARSPVRSILRTYFFFFLHFFLAAEAERFLPFFLHFFVVVSFRSRCHCP